MTSSSDSDSALRELQFAAGPERPTVPGLTVYRRRELDLLGTAAEFAVIGSSHYVAAPQLGFYETASCKDLGVAEPTTLTLTRDLEATFDWTADGAVGHTEVSAGPLSAFPADREYDLRYDFERRATTAIAVGDGGYETYHTYPELDLTLYTRTSLEPR